ncbi:dimethylaniline monooxygenase [N-oxide-forming] 4 isoform X6 [Homo sapiens]|uniref:dimethylaniline monooxygenase [N-oxide-forming] 4 isoform X6 n=1 Tax=Homo sapiens TaxID=9606 RepID=UPI000041FAD7|nr:dimethylaniline monooxygenase [N-oxide-forming] 4 isoform X6 [Homo sapiens]XP_054191471.1 dimethylaniline monooxygenase [N-oxide-forming] 4 isoform X6 [Homo sapiens]|eukprot:XP_006711306.1 dimethylaniline monooxygenase [N-oxide-forming] 4 isoform X5 [Homo sapiens]
MAKKVAVIGAGVSGLSSIKCCVDEDLEPTCFERSDDIGGLWKFTESSKDGMTRVYKSLVTNVCKEMSCYSDFPFHEDYPNFMNHEKFWDYLQEFAEHFDLLKYIQFKTTVCSITKRPDFSETGQWDVVTETEGKQNRAVFDAVMVCTGHFLNPHLPLEAFPEPLKSLCTKKIFLYKQVFPLNLERATLAIIGLIGLKGSILSGTELQARWVTRVFKGLCKIPPSQKLMMEATEKEQLIKRGVFKDTSKDKFDYIAYMDDIAACIGTKPSIPLLFLKDPRLAWEVFFGPCTPYQYRLMGPGKWDGARNAILTQWDRTLKPLKTRIVPDSSKPASMSHYLKAWGAPVLLASLLLICKSSLFLKLVRDKLQDRMSPYLVSLWRG